MIRLYAFFVACACLLATVAAAEERYAGYYYPEITSTEDYTRLIRSAPPAAKAVRVEFVTNLTLAQLAAPESPRFEFFAKGSDSRHLIVVALDDEVFSTLFRARAVMAQMTSNLRQNDFLQVSDLRFLATFYDLLQLMQFDTLVLSDGKSWSHQVNLIRD